MTTAADVRSDVQVEIERFLVHEADLLDTQQHDAWLELLHDDFLYTVPVPVPREDPRLERYDPVLVYTEESKSYLTLRFGRVTSDFAWSERPSAFTRHFVSNFKVDQTGPDSWTVRCNVLVVRARRPEAPVLSSAERRDEIVRQDGRLLLRRRTVFLDAEVPTDSQLSVIY